MNLIANSYLIYLDLDHLLFFRPEARVVVRPKRPGFLVEAQEDKQGQKRLKFGLQSVRGQKGREIRRDLSEDSQMRCDILRQFGIMWLAPFCHLTPGRLSSFSGI